MWSASSGGARINCLGGGVNFGVKLRFFWGRGLKALGGGGATVGQKVLLINGQTVHWGCKYIYLFIYLFNYNFYNYK